MARLVDLSHTIEAGMTTYPGLPGPVALATGMRAELGVRPPDHVLGGERDVASIPQALVWSAGLAVKLLSRRRLLRDVFAG